MSFNFITSQRDVHGAAKPEISRFIHKSRLGEAAMHFRHVNNYALCRRLSRTCQLADMLNIGRIPHTRQDRHSILLSEYRDIIFALLITSLCYRFSFVVYLCSFVFTTLVIHWFAAIALSEPLQHYCSHCFVNLSISKSRFMPSSCSYSYVTCYITPSSINTPLYNIQCILLILYTAGCKLSREQRFNNLSSVIYFCSFE